jgi:preprotein translocase subunit SecG
MTIALTVVHVIMCFAIIGIVLLQAGKGADIGSAFGGAGSQAVFGSMGTPTILGKVTTVVAIIFTITSFSLALLGGERSGSSVVRERPAAGARDDAGTRTGDAPTPPAPPAPVGSPSAPATPAPAPAK